MNCPELFTPGFENENWYCIATLVPHVGVDRTECVLGLHKVLQSVADGDGERDEDTSYVDVLGGSVIDAVDGQGKLNKDHPVRNGKVFKMIFQFGR